MKILFLFFVFIYTSDAQLLSSTGSYSNTSKYQITYAVGDISTKLFTTDKYFIGQGFLYFENDIISSVISDISIQYNIFPTPCNDILFIKSDFISYPIRFIIFDINNNIKLAGDLFHNLERIDINSLITGTYFIMIKYKNNHKVKKILVVK